MIVAINMQGTTDASGNLVITRATPALPALLYGLQWIDGDFADGVDATLEVVARPDGSGAPRTLATLTDANDDGSYFPRQVEHTIAGLALTSTTPSVIDGHLKLTISAGGNAKTGGCVLYTID